MIAQFINKYEGSPSESNVVIGSLDKIASNLPKNNYDLIIACYLFSSLDQLPDLSFVPELLKDSGYFVVADTHPDLAVDGPQIFAIEHHGKRYGLELSPVQPIEIQNHLLNIGLKTVDVRGIQRSNRPYSYVYLFSKDSGIISSK